MFRFGGIPATAGSLMLLILAAVACSTSDADTPDGGASDARASDARTSDARTSDARTSDARTSDAQTSDAQTSDAVVPDAGAGGPDASERDGDLFDGSLRPDQGGGGHALPVNLGQAEQFAVLAKTAISTVPESMIVGNLGISPAAATFITGFSLTADATNVFATSTQVVGQVYAANYAPPTPANMTQAISDMELAFTDAAGRAPDVTELGAGDIGGFTLGPGVYKWGSGLLLPTNVVLTGAPTDVWIFQIAGGLTVSEGVAVILEGGARSENVFWQVSGAVDLGTTAHLEGTLLAQTLIRLHTGASVNGRLMSQTMINIESSTVVAPE